MNTHLNKSTRAAIRRLLTSTVSAGMTPTAATNQAQCELCGCVRKHGQEICTLLVPLSVHTLCLGRTLIVVVDFDGRFWIVNQLVAKLGLKFELPASRFEMLLWNTYSSAAAATDQAERIRRAFGRTSGPSGGAARIVPFPVSGGKGVAA